MRRFVSILKPGIIFGNAITLCGGFFLGSSHSIHFGLLLITLIGMSLIIGSGCVFNNVIDRDIDALMARTRYRVLVQGLVSPTFALLYASLIGIAGFMILYFKTNLLTLMMAALGWFFYVVIYSLSMKRKSSSGTLVGAISGAIPPVVGYTAITNHFDVGALIVFFILFFWQMPHFYAISMYRIQDYKAANIPVLPLRRGILYTKVSILIYIVAFTLCAILPSFFGYTGYVYGIVAFALGINWLYPAVKDFYAKSDALWARKVFLTSIFNITILCLFMAFKY